MRTPSVLKKGRIRYSYNGNGLQSVIAIFVVVSALFSLFPLFLTIINSMKSELEVTGNIFALPNITTMGSNIAANFSEAWGAVGKYFLKTILVALIGAVCVTLLGAVLSYILVFKNFYLKNTVFLIFIAVLLIPSIIGFPILVPLIRDTFHLGDTYFGYLIPTIGGCQVGAMFLFRTFFSQQPKSIYESAKLDGANDFHMFFRLTVPLGLPILLYYAVGIFSNIYNDYLWASLILDNNLTMMPIMFSVVADGDVAYGAMYAMYLISSLPLIVTTFVSMKYFASGEFASGMKL